MRIGVDATVCANRRGYGRFAREIIPAMARLSPHDEFVCFLDGASNEALIVDSPNVTRRIVSTLRQSPTRAASAEGHRSIGDLARMTLAVKSEKLDVFFSPSVYTYFPLAGGLPLVLTIHDAIPERFPEAVFLSSKQRLYWSLKMKLAVFQSRRIVTVSDYAAGDLVRVLGIPREKITVAVEAPSAEFRPRASVANSVTSDLPPGGKWIVYVGGFSPHKNVPLLVQAHANATRELEEEAPYLLLIGTRDKDDFHTDVPAIEQMIAKEGTSALVKWAGFVDDENLSRIHSQSVALVLPSACEGFGLPAVEAAACGSPVIATTESPLPALLEGAGIFVNPGQVDQLAQAIIKLSTDHEFHSACSRSALARANALSWDASARAVMDAIGSAAA
ncbi:MAG TPA: glycosyltransferase family 1 protein [Gemmatimonadaceae bacterium]|nr:glycosyltransferase family 1 protein [Gemmatimonadaceae bacterium]